MIFPLMVRPIRLALQAIDPRLRQAARTLGASPADSFATITLPLAAPGILLAIVLGYTASLGEFGAVITFAASIPGETRTLPLAIYAALQTPGGEAQAATLSLVSLALALAGLIAAELAAGGERAPPLASKLAPAAPDPRLPPPLPPAGAPPRLRITAHHPRIAASFETTTKNIAIVGPSGAGKSTLLATIAGLLPGAETHLDGERLRPEHGTIGLVFQDGLLFPHLTVEQNLRYGLTRARRPGVGLDTATYWFGLAPLLHRKPATLSGGERQRAALARAILAHPRLLLLDEPLAGLDTPTRRALLHLIRALPIPLLYVSHAADEVAALAETIVLIENGRQIAAGPPATLAAWTHREDAASALPGRIAAHDPAQAITAIDCGPITIFAPPQPHPIGAGVRVLIPARDVILARDPPAAISVNNILPAIVQNLSPEGSSTLVVLTCGPHPILARVTTSAAHRLALTPGLALHALIKSMAIQVI